MIRQAQALEELERLLRDRRRRDRQQPRAVEPERARTFEKTSRSASP
jgi:hypothetical protein